MRRLRNRYLVIVDAIGIALAAAAAVGFRFDPVSNWDTYRDVALATIALMLLVRMPTQFLFGLYRRDWRHASTGDLQRIVLAMVTGTVVAAIVAYVSSRNSIYLTHLSVPRLFWPAELFMSLLVVGGARFAIRAASDHISARAVNAGAASTTRRPTLLYGAGHVGALMARSAVRNPGAGVEPIGFLDDDPSLRNARVVGLRVFGPLDQLEHAIETTGATDLLITMPSAKGATVRTIVERATSLGVQVRTVPAIEHLLDGTLDAYRARRVNVEDLLRRPMAGQHAQAVSDVFTDQVVLITGAAGSIGSELARQVLSMRPRRLILLDRAESPLYLVQRDLEERAALGQGAGEIVPRLGNVVSRTAMARLVASDKPDVILHAAAYKHVPLLEQHPEDAVQVNVAGTLSVLDAAAAAGVPRFVLVSTDKAVKPSSIMGASKRIAEMLVLDTAQRTGRPYVAVRFGNVLGSAGSVVPIFQEQLEKGRPLTITHPEMTRFFMTIPEAAWLILEAAAMGAKGDLFVLDMGEPVKILDLARDVARLAGRDPDSQPIEVMGLRPGEKLHEELFYAGEKVEMTDTPKVMRAHAEAPPVDIRDQARALILEASSGADDLGRHVHAVARGDFDGMVQLSIEAPVIPVTVSVAGEPISRHREPTQIAIVR
ncbi:MAG: nucleoside-diphosphate sugar epimerase/dehydratase [Chloroflexota bacterium]